MKIKTETNKTDLGIGIGLMVLSLACFFYAEKYKGAGVTTYGPNFFPQFLAIIMFLSALVLVVQSVAGKTVPLTDKIHFDGLKRSGIALAIGIAYLVIINVSGFSLATLGFLFGLMTFIGQQDIKIRALSSVIVTLITWAIFSLFLKIPLPPGVLGLPI